MDRPVCEKCKKNLAELRGNGRFRKTCSSCRRTPEQKKAANRRSRLRAKTKGRPWTKFKKDHCENPECRWVGRIAPFQLGVDHIDGNKNNNDHSNLMTLCHNCHAMKTYLNQEWNMPGQRGKNVWVEA